ncbi:MAG TPA: phage tail protein I [Thermoanaerobaculia bacterium]|jgi:phage tail-like protein|nr:phage tail protein I [Thermoanaerobaculia bacterium]
MDGAGFLYLNAANRWPGFQRRGLELGEDGGLRLARVPLLDAPVAGLADLPAPDGPAGVAVGPDGAVYFTDPGGDRLLRIDPCDGAVCPLPCFGGTGEPPARLRAPRGLVFHPTRRVLVVADSGNDRLQLVDPETFQLLDVWGGPGTEPGRFDAPWALAADAAGNVYAVDSGNRRVQKFGPRGDLIAAFWDRAATAGLDRPVGVTVAEGDGGGGGGAGAEVYVLDAGAKRIAVFDAGGNLLRRLGLPAGAEPLAILFAEGSVYVGDNAGRHLLRLLPDGSPIGEAEGFEGPVAALAAGAAGGVGDVGDIRGMGGTGGMGGMGGLWLHPGGGATPVRLLLAGGRVRSGVLWSGRIGDSGRPILWNEIEVLGGPLAADAHLQLFVHTGGDADAPPDPSGDPLAPFPAGWTPLPLDALRGLVRGAPAEHLWIGAHLAGEGRQTPAVTQIRVDYDPETWSRYLPAIYRRQAQDPELLERFLALYQSLFTDLDAQIDGLPRLFDPAAAPAAWLPWLAGWLGIELDETWPEEKKRRAVAGAWAAAAKRGTPAGLREAVLFSAGVDVRIVEPVLGGTWWTLPHDGESPAAGGRLGFDTVLAPAELDGAVVGTTAVLDGSYLAGEDGLGSHLYETVAHQFCVQVYERQVASPARLAAVRAAIEREKPAHTAWHLCVIAPRLRVGFQSRVGVDTVVAGPSPARRLGRGPGLVLGGEPPGRVGESSRVGTGTRLGSGAVARREGR